MSQAELMLDFYMKFAGRSAARLWSDPWLQALDAETREELITCSTLKTLPKKKTIFWIGDEPDGLWGVLSGSVIQSAAPNERGPVMLHMHQPGSWFGASSLYGPWLRTTMNVTSRSTSLAHLPISQLERVGARSPQIWRCLGILSARLLAEAMGSLDDTLLRSGRDRIVAAILRLGNVRHDVPDGPRHVEIDATQGDLAQLTGLSRTIVAQHLVGLRDEGFISCSYGRLELLDIDALHRLLRE